MQSEPDVVIIGAGAAGIAAARGLVERGFSVVILEALPRPGGRAFTAQTKAGALDLGCGWLHSAERNPWVAIAEELGIAVDRRPSAWNSQYRDLGFDPQERRAAEEAYADWNARLSDLPPCLDRASAALDPAEPWNSYIQAISGYINGDELERISARDYGAYDAAASEQNWRIPSGYGHLILSALPADADIATDTAVKRLSLEGRGVRLETMRGALQARAAILTLSTHALASESLTLPQELDAWREAATALPLGNNEKLFLEILGQAPFENETHVLGNPRDPSTGTYYIRPFGQPVIECFFGGAGARAIAEAGEQAAFEKAIGEIVGLFGSAVRPTLRPLLASAWSNIPSIGGSYSHALPGRADQRLQLARPFDDRIFFAGEATEISDFSTAHGAYRSGRRAAAEVAEALGP